MNKPIRVAVFGSEKEQALVRQIIVDSALDGDIVVCDHKELVARGALERANVPLFEEVDGEREVQMVVLGAGPAATYHVDLYRVLEARHVDLYRVLGARYVEPESIDVRRTNRYPIPRRNKRAHYQR